MRHPLIPKPPTGPRYYTLVFQTLFGVRVVDQKTRSWYYRLPANRSSQPLHPRLQKQARNPVRKCQCRGPPFCPEFRGIAKPYRERIRSKGQRRVGGSEVAGRVTEPAKSESARSEPARSEPATPKEVEGGSGRRRGPANRKRKRK